MTKFLMQSLHLLYSLIMTLILIACGFFKILLNGSVFLLYGGYVLLILEPSLVLTWPNGFENILWVYNCQRPWVTGWRFNGSHSIFQLGGTLVNTGHDVSVFVEHSSTNYVNVSGGPLSYQYRIVQIAVHFGSQSDTGSEHAINESRFPAEVVSHSFQSSIDQ